MKISRYYDLNYKIHYINETDEIKSNLLYRNDILKVFNISYNCQDMFIEMRDKQDKMYEILKKNEIYNQYLEKIINVLLSHKKFSFFVNNDHKCAFSLLFNYDYFYIFHDFLRSIDNIKKMKFYSTKIINIVEGNK